MGDGGCESKPAAERRRRPGDVPAGQRHGLSEGFLVGHAEGDATDAVRGDLSQWPNSPMTQ